MLNSATQLFASHGSSRYEAARQAYGFANVQLQQQATMLAYIDNFWLLGLTVLLMIPFVFLMKKVKPGGPLGVH